MTTYRTRQTWRLMKRGTRNDYEITIHALCNVKHDGVKWLCLNPMTADLWKAWQAAHGIKGEKILGNNVHFVIADEIQEEKNNA